ncbi:hypothetical protein J437_LFUL001457 [Ladona fulva]|uniref:Cilia- and flagella-associated protein 299 n=1 Tax=Ladona fulva TaxID=123851 RepID=A0A8K0NWG8_LADFU|nr:hypothetical protein J437_LFUL001457 [Ladona fulva]
MDETTKSTPNTNLHEGEDEENKSLLRYSTYDEYLESLVTDEDVCYLQNYDAAKMIAELGYRFTGDTITEAEFYKKRAQLWEDLHPSRMPTNPVSEKYFKSERPTRDKRSERKGMLEEEEKPLSLGSVWLKSDPLLRALAERERENLVGILATIIFIRDIKKSGNEVSGYIDYADRLFSESWEVYFSGRKKLVPRKSDLAYYDWKHNIATWKSSRNFRVLILLWIFL